MKKALTIFMLIISAAVYSQTKEIPGTTEEEYLYFSTGLPQDAATGRDLKEGYSVKQFVIDSTSIANVKRYATVYAVMKEGQDKPRGFFVVLRRPDTKVTQYFVIPNYTSSPEMTEKAFQDMLTKLAGNMPAVSALNHAYMQLSTKLLNGMELPKD